MVKVREVMVTTMKEREEFHADRDKEKGLKEQTMKKLASTENVLKTTKEKLASTESELKTTVARVEDLDKQKTDLKAQLETTTAARDTAQQELMKWAIIDLKPEQVKGMIADLKKTTTERNAYIAENKVMNQKVAQLNAKINDLLGENKMVELPPGLRGKVLTVDPKYQFVVLNVGGDQGVLERGEVLASRNGRLVAKLKIASVEKNTCIANILPGWQMADLREGDQVISVLLN